MNLISNLTEYGLLILLEMTRRPRGSYATVRDLGEKCAVPPRLTHQIISTLVKNGWLYARRGRQGGVTLAADPERILVGDVVIPAIFPGSRRNPSGCELRTSRRTRQPPINVVRNRIRWVVRRAGFKAIGVELPRWRRGKTRVRGRYVMSTYRGRG